MTSKQVDTNGGAYIEGEVKTNGGDFIGRDMNIVTEVEGNIHIGDNIYQKTKVEEFREELEKTITNHKLELSDEIIEAKDGHPTKPYRHMDYFKLEHKNIFFGRDEDINKITSLIFADYKRQITIIHAPSGAGKTSLLNIIKPELYKKKALPLYIPHPNPPPNDPIKTIKDIIFPAPSNSELLEKLPLSDFLHWVSEALRKYGLTLILILDQFEEFFIELEEVERQKFIIEIRRCNNKDLSVKFVIAIRKDYFSDLAQFAIKGFFDSEYHLLPLTTEQARMAIEGPIQNLPVKWEEASIQRLLAYWEQGEIDPPQLQLVCATRYEQLYEIERKTLLTVDEEDLKSIYSDFLSNTMDLPDDDPSFPKNQRELGWLLLKSHLLTSRNTKSVRLVNELYKEMGTSKSELDPVIEYLVTKRILRRDANSDGQPIIEIAHDTFAREIANLQTDQERLEKSTYENVDKELTSWLQHEKSSQFLMSESRLMIIDENREYLVRPTNEMLEYLLRSALVANYEVEYWLEQAQMGSVNVELILLDHVRSENFKERQVSLNFLARFDGDYFQLFSDLLRDKYPQIRMAAILQLEKRDPQCNWHDEEGNTWRELLYYERYIPSGKFLMRHAKGKDIKRDLDSFYIGRYPVTNAEYKRYKDDIGEYFEIPQSKLNHPVININFFEAEAYAKWAGMRLLDEEEWEKAASWNADDENNGASKTVYPWGEIFDLELCNNFIMSNNTTPVGAYSNKQGDSPYGVADLVGNVWEWTNTRLYKFDSLPNVIGFKQGVMDDNIIGFSKNGPYGNGRVSFAYYLFGLVVESFNLSEFQELTDKLGFPYEKLPGHSLFCKVRELIKQFQNEERIYELVKAIKEERPFLEEELNKKIWEINNLLRKIKELIQDFQDENGIYELVKEVSRERPYIEEDLNKKIWEVKTDLDFKIETLYWILVNCFSEDELLDLCLYFFPNYTILLPLSHTGRASELISYLEYYGLLRHLDYELQELRPRVIKKFFPSEMEQVSFIRSRPSLKEEINKWFLDDDIPTLCFNLGDIPGLVLPNAMKRTKIREYIFYLERRHRLSDLRNELEKERDFVDWHIHFETVHLDINKPDNFTINEPSQKRYPVTTLAKKMHEYLTLYFDTREFDKILKKLGTTIDNLQGGNLYSKTREGVLYCEQKELLVDLVREIIIQRPFLYENNDEFLFSLWEQQKIYKIFQEKLTYDEFEDITFEFRELIQGNTLSERIKSLIHQMNYTGAKHKLIRSLNKLKPQLIWEYSPDEILYFSNLFPIGTIIPGDVHAHIVRGGSYRSFISANSNVSKSGMIRRRKADNLGFRVGFSLNDD